jgi:nanoRNase/pAp phosphatase (c-di-AMP/oligoRNAs hydrolase)
MGIPKLEQYLAFLLELQNISKILFWGIFHPKEVLP